MKTTLKDRVWRHVRPRYNVLLADIEKIGHSTPVHSLPSTAVLVPASQRALASRVDLSDMLSWPILSRSIFSHPATPAGCLYSTSIYEKSTLVVLLAPYVYVHTQIMIRD